MTEMTDHPDRSEETARKKLSRARNESIAVSVSKDERDYVRHAARLRGLSLQEYVRKAINASLRREGVDAVLLRERSDD